MMVTNLCAKPSSTITLRAGMWTNITPVPSKIGMKYWINVYVNVTGGTISISGVNGDISASQRIGYSMISNNPNPVSMSYSVKSGNPTVTVTDMLLCTFAEYQANKTLLDSIGYFTGDTMPLA
jgi:hypothetical protein